MPLALREVNLDRRSEKQTGSTKPGVGCPGGLGRVKGGFLKPMLFHLKLGELAKQRGKERCTRKRVLLQGKGREMEICAIKMENRK